MRHRRCAPVDGRRPAPGTAARTGRSTAATATASGPGQTPAMGAVEGAGGPAAAAGRMESDIV
eukprot:5357435-Alexandrium_andersonii.AAC.1